MFRRFLSEFQYTAFSGIVLILGVNVVAFLLLLPFNR